ncbi:hypothetical protein [Thermococcus sp.]|uniref:hypothetical protein n=1 Tax=Thermococcus sp. TaxID=35749 RepID=UPI0025FD315E|nr:hypothetical protein [Thermococcus sp.]
MREISLVIAGMLLLSLIPHSDGVSPGSISASTKARGLLLTLDRLANYTKEIGCNSTDADAVRMKAWELYKAGSYNESIKETLKAMELYYSALAKCQQPQQKEYTGSLLSNARVELSIAQSALEYAKRLIESGDITGENLKELELAYNQTLFAYNAVRTALGENDTEDLAHRIALLHTSREKLENVLNNVVQNTVRTKAEFFGEIQLRRLDRLIEKTNSTELLLLRAELDRALKSGNSDEILKLLKEVPRVLREMERKGKLREITHTIPGHPSFPGSSIESSSNTTSKKPPEKEPGEKR